MGSISSSSIGLETGAGPGELSERLVSAFFSLLAPIFGAIEKKPFSDCGLELSGVVTFVVALAAEWYSSDKEPPDELVVGRRKESDGLELDARALELRFADWLSGSTAILGLAGDFPKAARAASLNDRF